MKPEGDAADEQAHVRFGLQEPAGGGGCRASARALRAQEKLSGRRSARIPEARELHRERGQGDDGRLPLRDGGVPTARAGRARRRARARGRPARRAPATCDVGAAAAARTPRAWPAGDEVSARRARVRAASVVVPFARPRTGGRLGQLSSFPPAARSLAFAVLAGRSPRGSSRARPRSSPCARAPGHRHSARDCSAGPHGVAERARYEPSCSSTPRVPSAGPRRSHGLVCHARPGLPACARVVVVPEQAVAVVRRGDDSWLVSARGRVMGRIERGTRRHCRASGSGATSESRWVRHSAAIWRQRSRPSARWPPCGSHAWRRCAQGRQYAGAALGLLLRLGEPTNVRFKLAIAARILPLLASDTVYLDVSVPDRPVSGTSLKSQVEVESTTSTTT